MFEDGSETLLKGCTKCNGKFFFYINQKSLEKAKQVTKELTNEQKKEIEEDVIEILGDRDSELPVVLDFETINISEPGKYELDLIDMFKKKPLVYRLEEGKYFIDVAASFQAKNFDEKETDVDKEIEED